MAILLLAEHDNKNLNGQTAKALTAALALGGEIDVLVAGHDCGAVAEAAAQLTGVTRVLVADLPDPLSEPLAALIISLMGNYDAALAPATAIGKSVMPRVAALLDVMQISDIIEVVASDIFKRPTYAGNAIETVQSSDGKKIITVRTTAFTAAATGNAAPVETIAAAPAWDRSAITAQSRTKAERPELAGARVVVSGGRAFGSKEQFDALLSPLADKLNAAIGASRAAVDAGYAANDLQVGQTGQNVAPDLYIACGISGAIQHLAGMRGSKVIVAINSDPDAPIFKLADYGLVGDLFTLVPELTKAL